MDVGIISMLGTGDFCDRLEYYLKSWNEFSEDIRVDAELPRFSSGEGKAVLSQSVRGKDIFIVCDVFNFSVHYNMRGLDVPMSPDDHYQDIKRVIAAIGGKAKRITLIMPMLYEGRQHRRIGRESLDCALALQELVDMGVSNIVTFDAHDPRIVNAIPLSGFDNMQPSYQMIKSIVRNIKDINFFDRSVMIVSPDEGGVGRCLAYTSVLNLDLGMFYKQRNTDKVTNGSNAIVEHKYIGNSPAGKDVIVVDDIISSGSSLVDTFKELKKQGAKRLFAFITFGMFCSGGDMFDEAYQKGWFDKIFITNLTYLPKELAGKLWLEVVDLSKYTAYTIHAIANDQSVGRIIDPNSKINALLGDLNKKG